MILVKFVDIGLNLLLSPKRGILKHPSLHHPNRVLIRTLKRFLYSCSHRSNKRLRIRFWRIFIKHIHWIEVILNSIKGILFLHQCLGNLLEKRVIRIQIVYLGKLGLHIIPSRTLVDFGGWEKRSHGVGHKSAKSRKNHFHSKSFHFLDNLTGQFPLGQHGSWVKRTKEVLNVAHARPGLETNAAKEFEQYFRFNPQILEDFEEKSFLSELHQNEVYASHSHPLDFLVPTVKVPKSHRVWIGAGVQVVSVLKVAMKGQRGNGRETELKVVASPRKAWMGGFQQMIEPNGKVNGRAGPNGVKTFWRFIRWRGK